MRARPVALRVQEGRRVGGLRGHAGGRQGGALEGVPLVVRGERGVQHADRWDELSLLALEDTLLDACTDPGVSAQKARGLGLRLCMRLSLGGVDVSGLVEDAGAGDDGAAEGACVVVVVRSLCTVALVEENRQLPARLRLLLLVLRLVLNEMHAVVVGAAGDAKVVFITAAGAEVGGIPVARAGSLEELATAVVFVERAFRHDGEGGSGGSAVECVLVAAGAA